jgi:hypothetical protein
MMRPMSPAKKRSRKKKPAPTPTQFFTQMCPPLLTSMRTLCQEKGGVFAIVVDAEDGGTWSLDFGEASVREGGEGADVTITMTGEQFGSLTGAKVELRKLVADGDVACEGDRDRIEDLALVLAFLQR